MTAVPAYPVAGLAGYRPTRTCPTPTGVRPAGGGPVVRPTVTPRPAARPTPAVYRRRRLAVAGAAVALVPALHAAFGLLGGGPLTASGGPAAVPVAARTYVVQPGDTIWSIAHRLAPSSDERPLVARIQAQVGNAGLQPGQSITIP